MGDAIVTTKKIGLAPKPGSLRDRLAKANGAGASEKALYLLLDCSGSMSSCDGIGVSKINLLKQAVDRLLIEACNKQVRIIAFPESDSCPAPRPALLLKTDVDSLCAGGGTPMEQALATLYAEGANAERAMIVSDGDATDHPLIVLRDVLEKGSAIITDCVHIGTSSDGEALLKEIASRTGGIYIKFTSVENFRTSFKFLAPQHRALLLEAGAAAKLGAAEVQT